MNNIFKEIAQADKIFPMVNCFVATLDRSLFDRLKQDLIDQGFELSKPAYTYFQAKKRGISCTLYESGKLTVQGKDKEDFISFYLEPNILGTFTYSYPEADVNTSPHIGVDEAGKGDFFGPLCVAGLFADADGIKKLLDLGIKDSKKIKDSMILKLSYQIKKEFPYKVLSLYPSKYNELYNKFGNLNHLLAWGHATTIDDLVVKTGCKEVLVDQFADKRVVERALLKNSKEVHLTQRHRAEADPVVAGASILARAAFVEAIDDLSKKANKTLPKGASKLVIKAGVQLVREFGEDSLIKYAKLHFKTRDDVLREV